MNDTYAEWDTLETVYAIRDALQIKHDVTMIEANEDAYDKLRSSKPDIVFNYSEGIFGQSREAQIPAMLDLLQIPYTGSSPLTLTTCLDKARTKEILSYYNIPNPKFVVVENVSGNGLMNLKLPVMIKPLAEGSSKGIFNTSLISEKEELVNQLTSNISFYNQPFIVEEFLPGREFTVAILGNGDEAKVLPIVELNLNILPANLNPIYSYEAKWIVDTRDNPLDIFTCPANISPELESQIQKIALQTYKILRCKDWCRIDIRLDENNIPNIIEVNPLPGVLPDPDNNSCYPKAARAAGLSFDDIILTVLEAAAKRYGIK
ncbi:MAG: ATP-grasp domain-containing protein [Melioribacteraceae bacterium]|nr:ATP-grasp domain-containing protein [Melioribacteraceae bacterium]MCF8353496.1 ATP-grasp domain-containing protein [Melioribacteraceae bacterium]MCF8392625.1 ATP-grasp domain-containing protein [Melioribacteraceae bacterium]MCF8418503.1 ATP-grasp domain-containing protein [Melioribacteraceae bacterium]